MITEAPKGSLGFSGNGRGKKKTVFQNSQCTTLIMSMKQHCYQDLFSSFQLAEGWKLFTLQKTEEFPTPISEKLTEISINRDLPPCASLFQMKNFYIKKSLVIHQNPKVNSKIFASLTQNYTFSH